MGAGNQQERLSREERKRWFLAGVFEGEGSLCISIKKHPTAASGFYVDPEFFIYQHRNRRALLELAKDLFQTGTIHPKSGNPDVLVYAITSRRSISEKVVPFLEKYFEFSARKADIVRYLQAIRLFEAKRHHTREGLVEIVKLAYSMNHDGKQRQRKLEEVIDRILRGHMPDTTICAPAGCGEDMVRSSERSEEPGGNQNDLAPGKSRE
jgi:LAGLIDADG DNA endonuclease family protein